MEDKNAEEILKELDKKPEDIAKKQNKQLRNILIGIGIFILLILAVVLFFNSVRHFEYEGVDFEVVKEGEGENILILYNTKIPLYDSSGEKYADYNFYLRNDPRELKDILFEGDLFFLTNMVINSTEDFHCEGYGILAVANLVQLYEVMGTKVIKDENATCDEQGRYSYLNLKPGNETKIEKVGPACYDIIINNCEILKGTEKFMVETFIMINNQLNN